MSSRAVRYELNRRGRLYGELATGYGDSLPRFLETVVDRIARGVCYGQFERDCRDRVNAIKDSDPKFPVLA